MIKQFYNFSKLSNFRRQILQYSIDKTSFTIPQSQLSDISQSSQMLSKFITEYFSWKDVKVMGYETSQNNIENSFIQLNIPLSQNQDLQRQFKYVNQNKVRIGRILEVLDVLAGLSSYKHCSLKSFDKQFIVTACAKNILFTQLLELQQDIHINAYIYGVGSSSMRLRTDIYQGNDTIVGSAEFTMVSRDIQNPGKAYKVPVLGKSEIDLEKGELLQEIFDEQKLQDKIQRAPFKLQEVSNIYEQLAVSQQKQFAYIKDTCVVSHKIMHYQNQNTHGKIFGGFIMRESYEIAWIAGSKFIQAEFTLEKIQDIEFINPVSIGDIIQLEAKICLVQDQKVVIYVTANTLPVLQDEYKKCTGFWVVFSTEKPLKPVQPLTYDESVLQYEAKRIISHN